MISSKNLLILLVIIVIAVVVGKELFMENNNQSSIEQVKFTWLTVVGEGDTVFMTVTKTGRVEIIHSGGFAEGRSEAKRYQDQIDQNEVSKIFKSIEDLNLANMPDLPDKNRPNFLVALSSDENIFVGEGTPNYLKLAEILYPAFEPTLTKSGIQNVYPAF